MFEAREDPGDFWIPDSGFPVFPYNQQVSRVNFHWKRRRGSVENFQVWSQHVCDMMGFSLVDLRLLFMSPSVVYIPASSNVCKIIAFSGIIAGSIFFCLRTVFEFLSFCMCLPVLKRRKNPTKRRKNPTKRWKKTRAQNMEIETAKKIGNGENLGNRR